MVAVGHSVPLGGLLDPAVLIVVAVAVLLFLALPDLSVPLALFYGL